MKRRGVGSSERNVAELEYVSVNPRDRRHKLNEIRSVARELRSTAPAASEVPDLTSAILGRVDAEKPFLNQSTRRCLWVGRAAIGATVALVALSGFLMVRFAPKVMEPVAKPAPLSAVLDDVQSTASVRMSAVQQRLLEAPQELAEFVPPIEPLVSGRVPTGREVAGFSGPLTLGGGSGGLTFMGPMLPPAEAARREPAVIKTAFDRQDFGVPPVVAADYSAAGNGAWRVLFARSRLDSTMRRNAGNEELFGLSPALLSERELESGVAPR